MSHHKWFINFYCRPRYRFRRTRFFNRRRQIPSIPAHGKYRKSEHSPHVRPISDKECISSAAREIICIAGVLNVPKWLAERRHLSGKAKPTPVFFGILCIFLSPFQFGPLEHWPCGSCPYNYREQVRWRSAQTCFFGGKRLFLNSQPAFLCTSKRSTLLKLHHLMTMYYLLRLARL